MKKKTLMILCMTIASCVSVFNANAQKNTKTFSFGFGLEGGITTGDFNEIYGGLGGLTVRGSYKLGPGFATLTSGGILFLPKNLDGEDLKAGLQIPVKAGYKYLFNDHFFAMGEIGYSTIRYYFDDGYGDVASASQGGFTYAPAVGAQFGSFEVGLRYESTALTGASLSAGIVRLGFNF